MLAAGHTENFSQDCVGQFAPLQLILQNQEGWEGRRSGDRRFDFFAPPMQQNLVGVRRRPGDCLAGDRKQRERRQRLGRVRRRQTDRRSPGAPRGTPAIDAPAA